MKPQNLNLKSQEQSDYEKLIELAEIEVNNFLEREVIICEQAKEEGWLGESWRGGQNGLLGYMRTSYQRQLKILSYPLVPVCIPNFPPEIYYFFVGDWFENETCKNGCVQAIFKKEHFNYLRSKAAKAAFTND
jgi:hypothetical protein